MKRAFMSIKFYEGEKTKKVIDELTETLRRAGIENFVMIRDVEKWGEISLPSDALMPEYAFEEMEKSDMLIIEFSEKGVGLGIGAGYAYGKHIPIYIIAKKGSDISTTIRGLAKEVIFYEEPEDIIDSFKKIFERQKMKIILASKSKVRKDMLEENGIDFEVKVSDADENVTEDVSLEERYKIISRRKAYKVMEETQEEGDRIIASADQEIVFDGIPYGKPKTIDDARELIKKFMGNQVQAYVGNTILVVKDGKIEEEICETDFSTLYVDKVSDTELEQYLNSVNVCSICGGININMTPFVHIVSGRKSTARGMTIQYLKKASYQGF